TTLTEVPWPETVTKDASSEDVEEAKNYKIKVSADWLFNKADVVTSRYGNFFGIDHGWGMFSPPMARSAPFLAAELQFDDDSTTVLSSPNDPDVDQRRGLSSGYIRLGGWRQRKYEDYLLGADPDTVAYKTDFQIYQAYVLWCIRRWHEKNPGDPRQ